MELFSVRCFYLIPVLEGTHKNNIRKTQNVLNMVARVVLRKGRKTKIRHLMEGCGWLYIRELEKFQTTIVLWKMLRMRRPERMSKNFRMEEEDKVWKLNAGLQIVASSYRERAANYWNSMPVEIIEIKSLQRFKKNLKNWIKSIRNPMV